ncbi:MAG: hypothetical protein AABZ32_04700, partial [Bacteroidota bacterium]
MNDELERIFIVLEKPGEDERLPYSFPENISGQDPACDQSAENGVFQQWPLSLLSSDEKDRVFHFFSQAGIQSFSLENFIDAFSLENYESPNPFTPLLADISEKMRDEELSHRMEKAEIVFKIHYILKRNFGIDIFERIYMSSGGAFKPRKLWVFEDGADGFESFAIEKYYRERLRIKKVLDPRRYPKISKELQAEITKLLKQDLLRLRKPGEMTAALMQTYSQLYLRKPRIVVFEGLMFGDRNAMLSTMFKKAGLTDDVCFLDANYETDEQTSETDSNGVQKQGIGAKKMDDREFLNQFFTASGETDFFLMNDGLQHLPDPFRGAEKAYEALAPCGKLVVVSPYRFEEEELVLQSLWPLYRTPYRDSMLT